MKSKILQASFVLVLTMCLHGQNPAPTALSGAQIMPLLRGHDLKGFAALVHKPNSLSSKEVSIELADDTWNKVPFNKLLVADDFVALKSADDVYFVVCPFLPPTLEKLLEARTYHEMLQTLIPPSRSGHEGMFDVMDVSVSEQLLKESHEGFDLTLRAAFFHQNRIVWVECSMTYQQSQEPRSKASPFYESVIQIHASPKYK